MPTDELETLLRYLAESGHWYLEDGPEDSWAALTFAGKVQPDGGSQGT